MAFLLDQSRSHLAVNEADITNLFRSSHSAIPSDPLFLGHPCQAYVCATREKNLHNVFVALFDTTVNVTVIFTSSCTAKDNAALKGLINEAHKFTASMGFTLEPVNLDYSTAMRQVIIRGLRVMRPPDKLRPLPSLKANLVTPQSVEQPSNYEKTSVNPPPVIQPTEILPLEIPQPVTDLQKAALLDQITQLEKEKSAAELISRNKILELTQLLEQAEANIRKSDQTLKQPYEPPISEKAETVPLVIRKPESGSKNLRSVLTREKALRLEAESAIATLRDSYDIQQHANKIKQEELESLLLETRSTCNNLENSIANEVALRSKLETTTEETGHILRDKVNSLQNELEEQNAENHLQKSELVSLYKDMELLNVKLSKVSAAKEALQEQERRSTAIILEQNEAIRKLELHLKKQAIIYEKTTVEKELSLQESTAEIKKMSACFDLIVAEKKRWVSVAGNLREKARSLIAKLRKENSELEKEVKRLKDLKPATNYQHPANIPLNINDSPFARSGLTSRSVLAGITASTSGNGADFRHVPAIDTIHYRSVEEIIDLYGSGNVIQAAPFGRRSQNCNAYVCILEREGGPCIFLAWQLIDDGTVLFCQPEKQPSDANSYARMTKDALYYFESIGFMMDRFELSRGSERQLQALEKTGICRRDSIPALPPDTGNDDICHLDAAA